VHITLLARICTAVLLTAHGRSRPAPLRCIGLALN